MNFGTLNDVDATQNLVISNTSTTAGSLTLNTAANSTPGTNASDLLYVAAGGNLTVQSGAGTLTLNLATTGNIDNAGILNITSPLSIAIGQTATFTGTGATTVSGNIAALLGSVAINDAGGSVTLSGNNGYIGTTTITSGTLNAADIVVSGGTSNLGNAITAVTLGGAATRGLLNYTGNSANYTRGFTVNDGGGEVDVATAGQTLTIGTGNISTGSGLFTIGGAGSTSITSVIGSGSGGLTKIGTGTLALGGANTYGGATNINGGVLQISAANNLGSAAATNTIGLNGGILESTANSYSLGATRTITLNGAGTIQVDAGAVTVNGLITGANTLTETGSGNLVLAGANTGFTGAFVQNAGTLSIANTASFSANNTVMINAGTFDLNGTATETVASLAGTGGTVTNSSGTASVLTLGGSGMTTYGGTISATSATANPTILGMTIALTGSGSQTLSGTNNYTGLTTIDSGDLILGSATALGNGGLVRSVGTGGTLVNAGATLDLNGQSNINEALTLSGTGAGNNGALINSSATTATIGNGVSSINVSGTFSGLNANTTLSIGAPISGTTATAVVVLGVTAQSFNINGGTTTYAVAPTVTISGGGGTGATAVAHLTGGVVTSITVTNAGSGFTSVPSITFSGGTVLLALANPTGTGVDGHFTLDGVAVTNNGSGYTSTPTVLLSSGSATTTANLSSITLANDSSIGGNGNLTVNAAISGSATGLTKVGTGTLTLDSLESYTGATVVGNGTLALGLANAIATSTSLAISGGAVLSLGANNTTVNGDVTLTSGSISGPGTLIASSTGTSYSVINGSVSAVLGGTGDTLVKVTDGTGAGGTVILTGANNYTGPTSINAGILEIDGSLASGSTVTVGGTSGSASPTLTGTGTINGAVMLSSANGGTSGTINPGQVGTTGTLTVGSITFQNGSDLSLDINGVNSDLLNIVHAATIVSGAGIKIAGNALTLGNYVLADAASGLNSASFTVVGSLPSGYQLVSSSTQLDLQHLADQSLTSTSAASISIILNSSTPVGALLSNIVPVGSTFLNVNLSDAGGTGGVVTGLTSSAGTTIAGGASSTIAGTLTATTAGLGETWGIKNVDLGAITSTVTASGTLNVYNHSSPTLTIATGNNQSAFVGGTLTNATLTLSDTTGTFPAPLDVNTLINLTGTTGSGVVPTGGTGTYTSTALNTSTAGIGQTLGVSLRAGDQQTIIGAGPLSTLSQTITYNVYNHATPTLTFVSGNNQSGIVGSTLANATFSLANLGTAPAPLDVNSLINLSGATGSGVIVSGGTGTYTTTSPNTTTAGLGQTLVVSLDAGDQQTIPGATALSALSQTVTYNVYNHSAPTLTLASGNNQSVFINNSLTAPLLTLANTTGTLPAPLDVNTLSNLTGNTGSGVIGSGATGAYAATGFDTSSVGINKTLTVSLKTGDQQTITGANPLSTLSQVINYNVFNHATSSLSSGTLNLGNIHVGYTNPVTSSNSLTATNGAVSDLRVNLQGSAIAVGNVSLNSLSGIASGGSGAISATLATGQGIGAINTPLTYTFADQSALVGALNNVGTAAVTVGGEIYSGQSNWAGNGSSAGSWGTLITAFGLNWGANQGSPGLDANFTTTDTASFGNVSGQSTQLVTLDGADPSLNSIVFNGSSTSYTLAQGTGGNITLNGGAGTATVTDAATGGAQTISAAVDLATDTTINVSTGRKLTVSGNISGTGGVTTTGIGTTVLSGLDNYTDVTTIKSGTLEIDGSLAAASAVTVGGASAINTPTLTGVGTINGAVTVASGGGGVAGTINPGGIGTIGTLTVGSIIFQTGSTLALDVSGAASDVLNITHAATVAAGADIQISAGTLTLGNYVLANAASGLNGNAFTVLGSLPSGYALVATGTTLDLQHLSTASSFSATGSGTLNMIIGSTTSIGATLSNGAPLGSATLAVNLADNGGTGGVVTNLTSSTGSTVAAGASSNIGGTLTAGAVGLGETWSIKNTDPSAVVPTVTTGGTVNVYNHSTPTLTITNGNNQSGIVGSTLSAATLTLADTGTLPVPLDVNTLSHLTGATGSGVVGSNGTGTYTTTTLDTSTVGVGQTLAVGLNAGDEQSITGAHPLGTLSQNVTYNVYNHSTPTLSVSAGNDQSVFANGTVSGVTVTLADTGIDPAPLDVSGLSNLTGATGSGVVASGGNSVYTATGVNTTAVGLGQTQSVGLQAGDAQTIAGANPLTSLSQTVTYNVYNHATSNLTSGTLNLGYVHLGYASPLTSSNSLTVTNGAVNDLRVNLQGSAPSIGNISLNSLGGIASGSSGMISATLATGQAAGLINAPFTYTFADQSAIVGASSNVGTAAITVAGQVYSGNSVWIGNGTTNGSWGTLAAGFGVDWGVNQGSPGLDPDFTTTDIATFGNVGGQASQLVTLDGANPSLNSIIFSASSTAYTFAQGTGGTVTLNGGTAPASIMDIATGGTQTISAPVTLATNTNINVAANRVLTISGNISGSGGVSTQGPGTTVLSGTDIYTGTTTVESGTLAIAGTTLSTGTVMVDNGATLAGTGSTGNVAVSGGGSINLRDGVIGTLTVAGLTLGNAGTPSQLGFDIASGSTGNLDRIVDNGTLVLNGVAGTTINIGTVSDTPVLTSGTYTLISSTGVTGTLGNVTLSKTTLDGKSLSLSLVGNSLDLQVADLTTTTTYSLTASAADSRIMINNGSTTITSTIINSGSADSVTYTGLNATTTAGTLSGGTLPQAGGPLAANGGTASGTTTLSGVNTTGEVTITPTVSSATNTNLGGSASLDSANSTTVDVVANRVVTATPVSFGRVIVGQAASTVSTLSTTGNDTDFTRVTVGTAGPDALGISATGGTTETFNGASVTDTRTVGGTFSSAGSVTGTLTMITTGEGLAGEAPINVALNYSADPVNKRVITNGAATSLGLFHTGDTVSATSTAFTTMGTHDTTTDVSVAAGSGIADVNGVALNGGATVFNGNTSSDTRTFGGTINSTTGGVVNGSFNPAVNSLENGGAGLSGEGSYNPVNVAYTAFVYTGQGVWNASGGGSWGTVTNSVNWTADGGTPGLDPNFTSSDTATFGNSIGTANATIMLNGNDPSLSGINFTNTVGGSVTIADGSGGMLRMNGGGGIATLNNADGSNNISASMELDSNAAVFVGANANLDLSGNISESGGPRSLTVNGPGTMLLNGANTYSGGTTISSGTVVVGAASAFGSGNVTMNGGTMEAGNGMHEIDIAQNYTQTGGTLVLNLSGTNPGTTGGYEFLHVAGTAALGGALQVVVQPVFVPVNGDTFDFVQAGTITGGFSSETSNLRALSITPQGVGTITITQLPFTSMPCVQENPNENSIATYIDNAYIGGANTLPFQTLVSALDSLTAQDMSCAALADAFDQLSTEKFHNFARETVFNNASFSTQMLDGYLSSRRSSKGDFLPGNGEIDSSNLTVNSPDVDSGLAQINSQLLAWNPAPLPHGLLSDTTQVNASGFDDALSPSLPNPGRDFNLFVSGNVVLAQGFSQVDLSHFTTTTGGMQIGASYRLTPNLEVGTLFAYNHADGDLDNIGSKATIDSYAPGIFLSFADRGWYANALGTYGFDSFTENRNISFGGLSGTSRGTPDGNQFTGDFSGGYDFHVNHWTFGPTTGLQYSNLNIDGFSENGFAPTDLLVDQAHTSSLRSRLGAHVSHSLHIKKAVLTPHLDAFWQHEFLDEGQDINAQFASVGAGSFIVTTPRSSRDSALIDAGLNADLNGQVTVFADYLVQAGQNNYLGQSVQLGVKVGF